MKKRWFYRRARVISAEFARLALVGFAILALGSQVRAQTLRPDHWLSDHLRFEQLRGRYWELSPTERPLRMQDWSRLQDSLSRTADHDLQEFAEARRLFFAQLPQEPETLLIWVHSRNQGIFDDSEFRYDGRHILTLGMPVTEWLDAYTSVLGDNRLDEDPAYIGKEQSGMAGYTEQAYLQGRWGKFSAKFGRDYLRWGTGRDATLLMSEVSRPLDHLGLRYDSRLFSYTYLTAVLEPKYLTIEEERVRCNRYLSGHRIEIKARRNLRIGINETVLFGGPDRGYSFAYVNPFIFYHGETMNGPDGGNSIGSIDATWMPSAAVTLYGNFLIDDIQLENSSPGDREPDQLGCLLGVNWADPFDWRHADAYLEYTRITNRTYNGEGGEWEKWLHRGRPIGHFLGNDFDRVLAGLHWWPQPSWAVECRFEHRRHGEGRIENAFDKPWIDLPVDQTYHEPFPFGIVETVQQLDMELFWQLNPWLTVRLSTVWATVRNAENQRGRNESQRGAILAVNWDFMQTIRLR